MLFFLLKKKIMFAKFLIIKIRIILYYGFYFSKYINKYNYFFHNYNKIAQQLKKTIKKLI